MNVHSVIEAPIRLPVQRTAAHTYLGLEYLRALAALLVVYFHAALQIENVLAPGLFKGPIIGKAGVDIFFVLSGLVMWVSTSGKNIKTLDFYAKRIIRIVPLYWAATVCVGMIALIAPLALHSTKFEYHHFFASLFFIPWPTPAGHQVSDLMTPIMVVGWTLNFEMMFYAIFGIMLLSLPKWRYFLTIIAMTELFLAAQVTPQAGDALHFYGSDMIFEFLIGLGLAILFERKVIISPKLALILLILSLELLLYIESLEEHYPRLIVSGLPAMVIVFSMVSLEKNGWITPHPYLSALGSASYSIYLTHVFVISGMRPLTRALHWPVTNAVGQGAFVIVSLCATIALGLVVHYYFERPVTNTLKRRFDNFRLKRLA